MHKEKYSTRKNFCFSCFWDVLNPFLLFLTNMSVFVCVAKCHSRIKAEFQEILHWVTSCHWCLSTLVPSFLWLEPNVLFVKRFLFCFHGYHFRKKEKNGYYFLPILDRRDGENLLFLDDIPTYTWFYKLNFKSGCLAVFLWNA